MLTHPTHQALRDLSLDGMAEVFAELTAQDRGQGLDPLDWIGLMVDREQARRNTRRLRTRLRAANLRHGDACMEDVISRASRKLDRTLFQSLANPEWIERHRSVLITGPCGVGKSWLAVRHGPRTMAAVMADPGPHRHPRGAHRPLPPSATPLCRPRTRPRRRALRAAVPETGAHRSAHPR